MAETQISYEPPKLIQDWHSCLTEPDKCRLRFSVATFSQISLSQLYYSIASSFSVSDELHLGVGVNGNDVVALWGLDSCLGVGLTVQIVLDEEVAFLLEVDAAVIANEALRVVELVPGLHDGATG